MKPKLTGVLQVIRDSNAAVWGRFQGKQIDELGPCLVRPEVLTQRSRRQRSKFLPNLEWRERRSRNIKVIALLFEQLPTHDQLRNFKIVSWLTARENGQKASGDTRAT